MATSTKSQPKKTPVRKDKARRPIAVALAEMDSGEFLDQAIPFLRGAILRQMKENRTKPENIDAANKRARDSNTLSGLVRTLEKLNALDKSREKKGKKKSKSDAELKEHFVRRLDQLLAAGREASGSESDTRR